MAADLTFEYLPWRGITKSTMERYGVKTAVDASGKPNNIRFPYGNDAFKIRAIADKQFHSIGPMSEASLFGQSTFSGGAARAVTITEGELDALSAFQLLGSKYPVVSVRSSSSAAEDCTRARSWLNSFEKIYLCLDNDEKGQLAAKKIAALFDFNKVYHVQLTQFKDANEYLVAGKGDDFKNIWWNARRYLPEGVISSTQEFNEIIDNAGVKAGTPYPFPRLQEMTYGIRTGEIVLITALEGRGKTEIIRAIEHHLLRNTDDNLGIIHLEESKARTLQGLAGYELESPVHLPDSPVNPQEVKDALSKLIRRDDRLHLYSHFGSEDPQVILDTIRFLVTSCKCRYVFLDHITMVVSGMGDDDERKQLDYISTRLAMMVEELDFCLFLVSHVNDNNQTRGSRNISKVADLWIHLRRDLSAETEEERNTTHLEINKNRFGSRTGPGGALYFDINTFMVKDNALAFRLPPIRTPTP